MTMHLSGIDLYIYNFPWENLSPAIGISKPIPERLTKRLSATPIPDVYEGRLILSNR